MSNIESQQVSERLFRLLEDMTGQPCPFDEAVPPKVIEILREEKGSLGYSQINEILLLFGYDRMCPEFFHFLADGDAKYNPHTSIETISKLEEGINRFRKMAMLLYGNVKFAYKYLNQRPEILEEGIDLMRPIDAEYFSVRHDPIHPIDQIANDETYLSGYLTKQQIEAQLKEKPDDPALQAKKGQMESVIQRAKNNQTAYLASDHLDVYVATSMREQHEFVTTGRLIDRVFGSKSLRSLKLRWFDPTQAVCDSRIDKGLAEALMLKRARCTIYLAQESDTLGKDSELASTLAQGKTVIAYLPEVTEDYFDGYIATLEAVYKGADLEQTLLNQLSHVDSRIAWADPEVRSWLDGNPRPKLGEVKSKLFDAMKNTYDKRAKTLLHAHPLGIQVNLSSGVANGVLVARTEECLSELVYKILTQTLTFKIECDDEAVKLVETMTNSVYRVMTHDQLLTNTFWNFYLDPA